jgi:hypothetical protein
MSMDVLLMLAGKDIGDELVSAAEHALSSS